MSAPRSPSGAWLGLAACSSGRRCDVGARSRARR
jgi:hypothetical protein